MAAIFKRSRIVDGDEDEPQAKRPVVHRICPCLDWSNTITTVALKHWDTCPLTTPPSWKPWFDVETYVADPNQFHTRRRLEQTTHVSVAADEATPITTSSLIDAIEWRSLQSRQTVASSSVIATDPVAELLAQGKARLDRWVDIVNWCRVNIPECDKVYTVVDETLHYWFAQIHQLIVGEKCYKAHAAALHRYTGTSPKKQQSFMVCGRQAGKTQNAAVMLTALLCCADGGDLADIYATGQLQAALILTAVIEIYGKLPNHLRNKQQGRQNQSLFSVISDYDGLECRVAAMCSTVRSVRGRRPKLIVFDEFMMADQDFWENHVKALLTKDDRPMIAVSTPGEPGSFMLNMCIKIRDRPKEYPFAAFLNYSMVCDKHREANTPLECRCLLPYLPPWRSVAKVRATMKDYGDGSSAVFLKEIMGEPSDGGDRIFDPPMLKDAFFVRPRIALDNLKVSGNTIYIGIDPAKGGFSEVGITSVCWNVENELVLLGMESVLTKKAKTEDIQAVLKEHVRMLRRLAPWTETAVLVPLVEDTGGNFTVTNSLADFILERCEPSHAYVGYSVDKIFRSRGVNTDPHAKGSMVTQLQTLMRAGHLRVADAFFTTGIRNAYTQLGKGTSPQGMLQLAVDQLTNFHYEVTKSGKSERITGKVGTGKEEKDDAAMSLCLAFYWSVFCRNRNPTILVSRRELV